MSEAAMLMAQPGSFRFLVGDAASLPFPERHFDLVLTSPPYEDSRLYGKLGYKLRGQDWVDWMVPRILESCRVSRGLVLYVMAGTMRAFCYQPVVEWLVSDLTRKMGLVCGPSPYCYHRSGTPGKQRYHRRDWEPVYSFAYPDRIPPWTDPLAMGHPPKYKPGGDMTNRHKDGSRARTGANGQKRYQAPALANPGNFIECSDVITCSVGKGHMGNDLAHETEAPYPESLCDFLIRTYCPLGGCVLDPFSGSGTTVAAAIKAGRSGVGLDLRPDQAELGRARLQGLSRKEYLEGVRPLFPELALHNPERPLPPEAMADES